MLLARDIEVDGLDSKPKIVSSLKHRENAHAAKGTDEPHDANDNPSCEELLGEDVTGAIHWHWPENEKSESEDDRHCFCDLGGAEKLGLLDGFFLGGHVSLAGNGFEIDMCFCGHVVVVALADGSHGLPVVLVDAEDEGE